MSSLTRSSSRFLISTYASSLTVLARCTAQCHQPTRSFSTASSSSSAPLSRPRRALLYMPGSSPKMLQKAQTLPVDTVCMDLEDAVAANAKVEARQNIVKALESWPAAIQTAATHRSERLVRINPIGSGYEADDLQTILSSTLPDGIVLPKVESAEHVEYVEKKMIELVGEKKAEGMIIIALIESVEGMINIREIARSSKRLRALIFGADDYRASVGAIKTASNHEVSFARNLVLLHAKAAGLDAIDLVQTNFRDLPFLEVECREGFELGYTGKQIIHPNQIETVQNTFMPDQKVVEWARKVVAEAKRQEALGVGAFIVDGQMVDMPLIKKAMQIVARVPQ